MPAPGVQWTSFFVVSRPADHLRCLISIASSAISCSAATVVQVQSAAVSRVQLLLGRPTMVGWSCSLPLNFYCHATTNIPDQWPVKSISGLILCLARRIYSHISPTVMGNNSASGTSFQPIWDWNPFPTPCLYGASMWLAYCAWGIGAPIVMHYCNHVCAFCLIFVDGWRGRFWPSFRATGACHISLYVRQERVSGLLTANPLAQRHLVLRIWLDVSEIDKKR